MASAAGLPSLPAVCWPPRPPSRRAGDGSCVWPLLLANNVEGKILWVPPQGCSGARLAVSFFTSTTGCSYAPNRFTVDISNGLSMGFSSVCSVYGYPSGIFISYMDPTMRVTALLIGNANAQASNIPLTFTFTPLDGSPPTVVNISGVSQGVSRITVPLPGDGVPGPVEMELNGVGPYAGMAQVDLVAIIGSIG